jgi:hypothetical protein
MNVWKSMNASVSKRRIIPMASIAHLLANVACVRAVQAHVLVEAERAAELHVAERALQLVHHGERSSAQKVHGGRQGLLTHQFGLEIEM